LIASWLAAVARLAPVSPSGHPPPLLDAGALDDPVVRGLHHLREIVVGDHTLRHAHADSQDSTAMHAELATTIARRRDGDKRFDVRLPPDSGSG
jgi:hypothetical protein